MGGRAAARRSARATCTCAETDLHGHRQMRRHMHTRMVTRPTTLACAGYNNKCSTYTAYGMAYGLLAHDMVRRSRRRQPRPHLGAQARARARARA